MACPHADGIYWRSVRDLADVVNRPEVTSVVLDMNGSVGYLKLLKEWCPGLGDKIRVRATV